ncbi:hypothetical protein RF11_00724 [Thelohanellus kitauei]|uniref:Uncharacterized protein n=1 Tax=Thelohanellus kitauei TaxID=669202 RepID=A0A0C2N4V3_THEKT|nr:hypothetical protein RF11_00724 [Thelohanellus kitauei]
MTKRQLTKRQRLKKKQQLVRRSRIAKRLKQLKEQLVVKKSETKKTNILLTSRDPLPKTRFKTLTVKFPEIRFTSNWKLVIPQTPRLLRSGVALPSDVTEIYVNLTNVDKRSALWCFVHERIPPLKRANPKINFEYATDAKNQKPGLFVTINQEQKYVSKPTFNYERLKGRFCNALGIETWAVFPSRRITPTASRVMKILNILPNRGLLRPFSKAFQKYSNDIQG